jgi:hypothetical protein
LPSTDSYWLQVLLNLPHPLEFFWLIWLILLPAQLRYLLRRDPASHQLSQTGELMSFREITAVGCLGGFILLSLIFAFCSYLTLGNAKLI